MKITSLVLTLLLAASAAYAQFNGCPPGFCPVQGGGGGVAPPTCADDAPDGSFDLSKCSNAIYLAGIL